MLQFNEINDAVAPFMQAEIDNSMAVQGPRALPYRILVIGSATSAGSMAAKDLGFFTDPGTAAEYWGPGSQMHQMAEAALRTYKTGRIYGIAAVKDTLASAENKAVGSIAFTAATAQAGTIVVYIGGRRAAATIAAGLLAPAIADAVTAAINANPAMGVVAESTTVPGTVKLTAKNTGLEGNRIPILLNFLSGESLPGGVTAVITAMAGGVTNPDLTSGDPSVMDVLAGQWFQIIATPYTDSANQVAIDTEMQRKFGAVAGIDGVVIMGDNESFTNLIAKYDATVNGKNSKHLCIVNTTSMPDAPWEVAAEVAGVVCSALLTGNGAESMPFTTLPLPVLRAPKPADRYDFTERDVLLRSGISTLRFTDGGGVIIDRLVTNYQVDIHGTPDPSWRNLNYRFIAMFLRWDWVYNVLYAKYGRAKLAGDDAKFGPGQTVMTPKLGKAEALGRFQMWEEMGLVENYDQFKADLIAERNAGNVDRMDWLMVPDFVNQFYHGATKIAFRI